MFSLTQIAISSLVGVILAYAVVVVYARWAKIHLSTADTLLVALTVGVSILLWREAGNTPALNDDPVPVVSPDDVLCPVVTYVCLAVLVAFRRSIDGPHWPRIHALLTLLSLVVNVVTI
ncbi:MAG TPA: hypothetical protein VF937_15445 [Chloroflexota bacterium]